jgi:exopolysaccharide biosynthesis polyprenyl glycosylphosphotransferase
MRKMNHVIWRVLFGNEFKSSKQINRVLIVGSDKSLDILMEELENYPVKAYHIAGILNDNPSLRSRAGSNYSENGVVGVHLLNQGKLRDIVKVNQINTVVLSLHSPLSSELINEALELKYNGVAVYDMPTFYKYLTGKVPIFQVDGSWLLFSSGIGAFSRSQHYRKLKRLLDILFSALVLIFVSPILIISAIAIKLTSRGPIFYIQRRMGLGGREFPLIKFRTIVHNAESKTDMGWADKYDPRVTKVGRFLRKVRIDELPQLINVFKGDLSLVGPRPIRKYFEDQFAKEIPFYSLRHSVKPGITGWAQTRYHDARSEEGPLVRFQYDLFYIQESTLFLDLVILLKTIQTILCRPSQ